MSANGGDDLRRHNCSPVLGNRLIRAGSFLLNQARQWRGHDNFDPRNLFSSAGEQATANPLPLNPPSPTDDKSMGSWQLEKRPAELFSHFTIAQSIRGHAVEI